jgi:hypothetical protein
MVRHHHQQQETAQNIQFYHPFHNAQNYYNGTSCANPLTVASPRDTGFRPVSLVVNIPFPIAFCHPAFRWPTSSPDV